MSFHFFVFGLMISLSLLLGYPILGKDKMVRNTVRGDTNRGGGKEQIPILAAILKKKMNS